MREKSRLTEDQLEELEQEDREEEEYYVASQWKLIWWKLRKHKLAMGAGVALILLYLIVVFAEFLSPYTPLTRYSDYVYAPPNRVRLIGNGFLRPYIYGYNKTVDPATYRRLFVIDPTTKYPVKFFAHGERYKFWGLFRTDIHLVSSDGFPVFLLGTDRLGRDVFTRIMYGTRISLSIGLVGITFTFIFGLLLGGLSGFFGGVTDTIIQRSIDLLISIPTIPLWMALAAALPRDWPVVRIYFGITIIFSVIGWTGLARVVRGKLLSLREEDFVIAAQVAGSSNLRIIGRHLIPSFASYIIVSLTLSVPNMILGETALSFIGLGMQPPAVSWGTLLQDAQDLSALVEIEKGHWVRCVRYDELGEGDGALP